MRSSWPLEDLQIYRDFVRPAEMRVEPSVRQRTVGFKLWQMRPRGVDFVGSRHGDV